MVSDIEGVGEMFCVLIFDMMNFLLDDKGNVDYLEDFFGKEIYLMVLGQFNVEIYCMVMFKVYIFGLMFCVENLNMFCYFVEFWMIEFEVVFVELKDVVQFVEDMLKYVCKVVLEELFDDMVFFVQCIKKDVVECLEKFVSFDFVCMDYIDVIEIF